MAAFIVILIVVVLALVAFYVYQWKRKSHSDVEIFVSDSCSESIKTLLPKCNALHEGFQPPLFCWTPHVQTVSVAFRRKGPSIKVVNREILSLPDGGQVALDWYESVFPEGDDSVPVLLLLHGINGSAKECYMRGVASTLAPHMRVVAMIARGRDGVPLLTPRTFTAGNWEDAEQAMKLIKQRYPRSKLFCAGFSLGANILTNYMCDRGSEVLVDGAVAVSSPMDMNASMLHLDNDLGIMGKAYSGQMTYKLIKLVKENERIFFDDKRVNLPLLYKSKTLREFDDRATSQLLGFDSATSYYNANSCLYRVEEKVNSVAKPLLILVSADDPFFTAQANIRARTAVKGAGPGSNVVMGISKYGGHVGFFETRDDLSVFSTEGCWMDRVIKEWILNI